MVEHYSHLIATNALPAGCLEVRVPSDLKLIATLDTVDGEGVEQALQIAHQEYQERSWLSKNYRIEVLSKTAAFNQSLRLDNSPADSTP
jgi:hypothetical protein